MLNFPSLTADSIAEGLMRNRRIIFLCTTTGLRRQIRSMAALARTLRIEIDRGTAYHLRSDSFSYFYLYPQTTLPQEVVDSFVEAYTVEAKANQVRMGYDEPVRIGLGYLRINADTNSQSLPGRLDLEDSMRYLLCVIQTLANRGNVVGIDNVDGYGMGAITLSSRPLKEKPFVWKSTRMLSESLRATESRLTAWEAEKKRVESSITTAKKNLEIQKKLIEEATSVSLQEQIDQIAQLPLVTRVEQDGKKIRVYFHSTICRSAHRGRTNTNRDSVDIVLPPGYFTIQQDQSFPFATFEPIYGPLPDRDHMHPHSGCMGDLNTALGASFTANDLVGLVVSAFIWLNNHGAGSYSVHPHGIAIRLIEYFNNKEHDIHYPDGTILSGLMRIGPQLRPTFFITGIEAPYMVNMGVRGVSYLGSDEHGMQREYMTHTLAAQWMQGFYRTSDEPVVASRVHASTLPVSPPVRWTVQRNNPNARLLHTILHYGRVVHNHGAGFNAHSGHHGFYEGDGTPAWMDYPQPRSGNEVNSSLVETTFHHPMWVTFHTDLPNPVGVRPYFMCHCHTNYVHMQMHQGSRDHTHADNLRPHNPAQEEHHVLWARRRSADLEAWMKLTEEQRLVGRS